MKLLEILAKSDAFCEVVTLQFPEQKEFIRDKILEFLSIEENREKFRHIIKGTFYLEKNKAGQIVVTGTKHSCGEDIPRYSLIISKEEMKFKIFGEE